MPEARLQLLRFAVAGVAGLLADVLALYLLLAAGVGPYIGRVLSFLAAVWVTWQINRRFTFAGRADGSRWAEWWRYLGAMLGGGAVNYAVYSLVTVLAPAGPLVPLAAVAAGSLAGMAINFISAKFLVFRA
ncbi:MAG: GtrA family protein [Gammaproteobacteria bacterium]